MVRLLVLPTTGFVSALTLLNSAASFSLGPLNPSLTGPTRSNNHHDAYLPLIANTSRGPRPLFMFFADTVEEDKKEPPSSPSSNGKNENNNINDESIQIRPIDGSESSIYNAAKFMVDAFWLQSPQQLLLNNENNVGIEVSETAKSKLIAIQADDLMGKYGERMGRRKLETCLLVALEEENNSEGGGDTHDILGMVTIEVRLLKTASTDGADILNADTSEKMLTQAVAALPPKQRREYKDASVIDIARELLPPDITAVCSLSNLCVAPSARRRGIAAKLCQEAERMAREDLSGGFEVMHLRVESENDAAKRLYEGKLGYESKFERRSAAALRVDVVSGSFVEVESDIVVMRKKL